MCNLIIGGVGCQMKGTECLDSGGTRRQEMVLK